MLYWTLLHRRLERTRSEGEDEKRQKDEERKTKTKRDNRDEGRRTDDERRTARPLGYDKPRAILVQFGQFQQKSTASGLSFETNLG